MKPVNLHQLSINTDDTKNAPLENFSKKLQEPHFDSVELILRDEEKRLVELINEYKDDAIFGCVAWLTSVPILKALAGCRNVQVIVQKEDFLRPDIDTKNRNEWKSNLYRLYNSITCKMDKFLFRKPISDLSTSGEINIDGLRCVGNHNAEKLPAFPRMHHKFMVFCKLDEINYHQNEHGDYELINEHLRPDKDDFEDIHTWFEALKLFEKQYQFYHPVGVWTGSFNLTKNATQSFENAIYFEDKTGTNEIINAYLNEHHQIYALSEPLNWEAIWSEPEFRLGT